MRAADVLREHGIRRESASTTEHPQRFGCWGCAWKGDSSGHSGHQADMLAAAGLLATAEQDERITAWEQLVKHPFFAPCFDDGPVLMDAMIRRLDAVAPRSVTTDDAVERAAPVDREALATALHDAWKTADPESGPALYPSAFAETFGSLAEAALALFAARGGS